MSCFKKYLIRSDIDIQKSAYLWNTAAGLATASESVIFSIIATRLLGLGAAGIVTIGFAIGNLMAAIGKYGVRNFHVTDIRQKYSFSSYLYARMLTVLLMAVSTLAYMGCCYFTKGYSGYKTSVVLLICVKFAIDAVEDVFGGECQRTGRLDVSSKIYVLRSFCFASVFLIVLLFWRSLILALTATLSISILLECLTIWDVCTALEFSLKLRDKTEVKDIIVKCAPLCLSAFCFFYITNAPKYAIDAVMNDEAQACYSFIAFPVFAIELMNNFIYQPVLVGLAEDWTMGRYDMVRKKMHRQLVIILMLTTGAVIAAYFFENPLLSLIFSTDLSGYKQEMLALLFGGGLLAVIGYLSTILTTMRCLNYLIAGYCAGFMISLFAYTGVIERFGMMGGVVLYCILCLAFGIYEYLAITIKMKKLKIGDE